MKKKDSNKKMNILIIGAIVIFIGALSLMIFTRDKEESSIKEISYQEYKEIIKEDKYVIILLTRPTCSHCINYKPFVEHLASEHNLSVYDINVQKLTEEEYKDIHDSYEALKDDYDEEEPVIPTPATIITRNGAEKASITGDIGYNGLERLLKNNNVIK